MTGVQTCALPILESMPLCYAWVLGHVALTEQNTFCVIAIADLVLTVIPPSEIMLRIILSDLRFHNTSQFVKNGASA